ncbi:XkdW family protein [Paenibacillus gansuensis]|uniref:XkdW family protein n=1 Tax=Paenibacillus gansuensis TaxID=306542 RepID=A0ABW5PFZ4_9BACL
MILSKVILYLYPNAKPVKDFVIQDDGEGEYIALWDLNHPKPTKAEQQAAWEAYLSEEAMKPPTPPPIDEQLRIIDERTTGMQDIDQFTLEQLGTNEERTVGMQEIDEYTLELVFQMQATIEELRAEVAVLKGGA